MNIREVNFKVLVSCMTFNQSRYIVDAMNGFCMQKTDFPFICVIMDDASTDGEQEVIEAYLKEHFDLSATEETAYARIVCGRHQTNTNCYFKVYFLKENHYSNPDRYRGKKGEYIKDFRDGIPYTALCEGDDYWTDPSKLQMQADFLDKHADYSMCFHNAIMHYEEGQHEDSLFAKIEDKDYQALDFYEKWMVPTASVMFVNRLYKFELYRKATANPKFCYGDILLFISAAKHGKTRGFPVTMSVYRRQPTGVTYTLSYKKRLKHINHNKEIPLVFGKEFMKASQSHVAGFCMESFCFYNKKHEYKKSIEFLVKGLLYAPKTVFIIALRSSFLAEWKRKILKVALVADIM